MSSSRPGAKGNAKTSRDTDRFKQANAKQVKDRYSQAKTVKPRGDRFG